MVAVLHPHLDGAQKALDRIKAQFDIAETGINDETIFNHLLKNAPSPSIASQGGDMQSR